MIVINLHPSHCCWHSWNDVEKVSEDVLMNKKEKETPRKPFPLEIQRIVIMNSSHNLRKAFHTKMTTASPKPFHLQDAKG